MKQQPFKLVVWAVGLAIMQTNLAGQEAGSRCIPAGEVYRLTARASELDDRAREHPEIGFVFAKDGKPQDVQHAIVDTRVESRGQLVIWLMGHNGELFKRLGGYGLHAIEPHYARNWFSLVCQEQPVGETCRGDVRLEAATGEDYSDQVTIPTADGMRHRATVFVRWLADTNPAGKWEQFLSDDRQDLLWDKVILAGISHGSTTAARFAKHQKVARVVMFSGPRDQYQSWQGLPSATPANRYFGFTHVKDTGWEQSHYCRSWELLGLHQFGPLVNVDEVAPPYQHSRRLLTNFDVDGNAGRAHSGSVPGRSAGRNEAGDFLHEAVWEYLFTSPVDQVGDAVAMDDNCIKEQRQAGRD